MTERDATPLSDEHPEVPEADALEQRADAVELDDQADDPAAPDIDDRGLEADPADVAEQSRSVDVGDDEYR